MLGWSLLKLFVESVFIQEIYKNSFNQGKMKVPWSYDYELKDGTLLKRSRVHLIPIT